MSLPHGSRHALLHSAQFMLFLFRVACAAIPRPARSPVPGVNDVVARFVCSCRQMRAPAAVCKILTDHFVAFPSLSLFCAARTVARTDFFFAHRYVPPLSRKPPFEPAPKVFPRMLAQRLNFVALLKIEVPELINLPPEINLAV